MGYFEITLFSNNFLFSLQNPLSLLDHNLNFISDVLFEKVDFIGRRSYTWLFQEFVVSTMLVPAREIPYSEFREKLTSGQLVEITHGDGYVTRYAHNAKVLVKPGETVKRGDAIALMGSTGRSTGTHLHFEVLRHGKPMNPLSFVRR